MQISIEATGLDELGRTLEVLRQRAINTEPLMAELANHLYNTTDESFENKSSPDGISWTPLKASTLRTKKINRDKILYEEGEMRESLSQANTNDTATVGLNAVSGSYPYPVVHQFGSSDGTNPARPFMPIHSDGTLYSDTKDELQEIVEDYMRDNLPLE